MIRKESVVTLIQMSTLSPARIGVCGPGRFYVLWVSLNVRYRCRICQQIKQCMIDVIIFPAETVFMQDTRRRKPVQIAYRCCTRYVHVLCQKYSLGVLLCASCNDRVDTSNRWLGIVRASPFNSAKPRCACTNSRNTTGVSRMSLGGNDAEEYLLKIGPF